MSYAEETRRVVAAFLAQVRSGLSPERSGEFIAPIVLAHQVQSEDYEGHVREKKLLWGWLRF